MTMTYEEACEYVDQAVEHESESRAEYGSGAVSMGYDPAEWGAAYDGYRTAEDPTYAEARRVIDAAPVRQVLAECYPALANDDDIPF